MNVAVIGGSYARTNRKTVEEKEEVLEYDRDGLFNLVGGTNARVCIALARAQRFFIGSWSAYSCASWLHDKETCVILQEKHREQLVKKTSHGQRWAKAKCKIVTTKGPYHNPRDTDYDKVRQRIFNVVKNATK